MVLPISGFPPIVPPVAAPPEAVAPSEPGVFQQMFQSSVAEVNSYQQNAAQATDRLLSGESEDLHKVALDTQKAELSFEMFVQVRNKVVSAYQEIMRMQI